MVRMLAFLSVLLVGVTATADDTRAWVGIGGRNAIGPAYSDFGVYAMGGLWLLGEHLQPFVRAGWAAGGGDGGSIDSVRLGLGLAAGAPLVHEHLWFGGAAAVEGMGVISVNGGPVQWLGMLSLSAVFQLRVWKRLLVGVEAGPDILPSLLRSPAGNLEWDALRFNAGLRLGIILGKPVGN